MKKNLIPSVFAVLMLASCGGGASVANSAKPLVWFNRQPSDATTGKLDSDALHYNNDTYYVGFDAVQGAELQGQMIADYIKGYKAADHGGAALDRNGDGIIGYVLAIGDVGHNDSIARTRGIRSALGTAITGTDGQVIATPQADGKADIVKEGSITDGDGHTYTVKELVSAECKNSAGATWDAATAGNNITAWGAKYGTAIDIVASNNDGMGMAMFNAWSKEHNVATFGYDANSDAVAAIAQGYGGTITQHAEVQAYLTLRVLRNALDGQDKFYGITTADDAGNVLADGLAPKYVENDKSFYALNGAITSSNYRDYLDATNITKSGVDKQLDGTTHPKKKVLLNTYNSADNFLAGTYLPILKKFDKLLNLDVTYIAGDGQTEASVTNRFVNLENYDAYAINMIKTNNSASYTSLLD